MTDGEKAIIKAFAMGDKSLRGEAIAIYRENLRKYGISTQDPYFNFMSEVDNPVPDLSLRARYRGMIIKSHLSRHVEGLLTTSVPDASTPAQLPRRKDHSQERAL